MKKILSVITFLSQFYDDFNCDQSEPALGIIIGFPFITASPRSCGKVMFSIVSVSFLVQGSVHRWPLPMMPLVIYRSHGDFQTCSNLFTWEPSPQTPPPLDLLRFVHYVTHTSVEKWTFGIRPSCCNKFTSELKSLPVCKVENTHICTWGTKYILWF